MGQFQHCVATHANAVEKAMQIAQIKAVFISERMKKITLEDLF
jgi:hypothetical protein